MPICPNAGDGVDFGHHDLITAERQASGAADSNAIFALSHLKPGAGREPLQSREQELVLWCQERPTASLVRPSGCVLKLQQCIPRIPFSYLLRRWYENGPSKPIKQSLPGSQQASEQVRLDPRGWNLVYLSGTTCVDKGTWSCSGHPRNHP